MTTGCFFAVDRQTWARVCALGMNEAASYLVQARGTARDNRTTTWSALAIETYAGIPRRRAAAAAVNRLQDDGLVRLLRGGTKRKYELILPEQPDWIWLPNELVTGAAGERPPVKLVRQTQDVLTLRLLVDLYHAQDLREDGGIPRRIIWREFERVQLGEQAQFTVWGFRLADFKTSMRWEGFAVPHRRDKLTREEKAAGKNDAVDFFRRVHQLSDLGLIEWVLHLLESKDDCAGIIHPVGIELSDSLEDRLGLAAGNAGAALLTKAQYDWAVTNKGIGFLVPVPRHVANVALIGIARLRYRPHTRMTASWWADLTTKAEEHLLGYAKLIEKAQAQPAQSAPR
jgi:hypothetical protein